MNIVLLRHADAVPEARGRADEHRHLTSEGRSQAKALGTALGQSGFQPRIIYMSPLVRAVQTAEQVAVGAGFSCELSVWLPLMPLFEGKEPLEAELSALQGPAILVGHEPGLSGIRRLLTGEEEGGLMLHKCEALLIEDRTPRWVLSSGMTAPKKL